MVWPPYRAPDINFGRKSTIVLPLYRASRVVFNEVDNGVATLSCFKIDLCFTKSTMVLPPYRASIILDQKWKGFLPKLANAVIIIPI